MNEHVEPSVDLAPESLDSFSSWPRDKKVIVVSLVAAILLFGGCVAASVRELAALRPQKIVLADGARRFAQIATPKPEIHPLEFLPPKLLEFTVLNHQRTPGSDSYSAEGIYEPTDDETLVQMPRNVYANVTYHLNAGAAARNVRKWLEGYPNARATVIIRNYKAESGLTSDGGSYMVGWTEGNYSILVDGTFTEYVPATQNVLQEMTLTVAEGVADEIKTVLGRTD